MGLVGTLPISDGTPSAGFCVMPSAVAAVLIPSAGSRSRALMSAVLHEVAIASLSVMSPLRPDGKSS